MVDVDVAIVVAVVVVVDFMVDVVVVDAAVNLSFLPEDKWSYEEVKVC